MKIKDWIEEMDFEAARAAVKSMVHDQTEVMNQHVSCDHTQLEKMLEENGYQLQGEEYVRVSSEQIVQESKANQMQVAGNHYKEAGVQPWQVIDTWPVEQQIGFHRGNALKYLMRMGSKDEELQEIKKAHHYLTKLIEVMEKEDGNVK